MATAPRPDRYEMPSLCSRSYALGNLCSYLPDGLRFCNTAAVTVTGNTTIVFQAEPAAPSAPTDVAATSPTNSAPR